MCTHQLRAEEPPLFMIAADSVTICYAGDQGDQDMFPDFSSPQCERKTLDTVDPQNRLVWFKGTIDIPKSILDDGRPIALYVSGKMSSRIFLNGELVASNGLPARSAAGEKLGVMDFQLFPPKHLIKAGENEVIIQASSHHGYLNLSSPVHLIAMRVVGDYANLLLPRYIPALITLGLFLVGAFYYGTAAVLAPPKRLDYGVFVVVCGSAAFQLLAEASRGLFQYEYPLHDIRLIAITGFSMAFGLSVAFYICRTFVGKLGLRIALILAVVDLMLVFAVPGFDFKALLGMTIPLLASLFLTGWMSYQRKPRAFLHFLALLVFIGILIIFQGLFLDTFFYLVVAGFLMLLFVEQAIAFAREQEQRRKEETRANRLALALSEAAEREQSSILTIKSAGRVEKISTDQIVWCKAIDGYSELILEGGKVHLYSATLNELEHALPQTFLRVHRSHIVNLTQIKSLDRDPSGTGTLFVADQFRVPVSRRIMPDVRRALA
ncbi:LytTR family DNA-binding domain-containing protein [Kordiimonas sp. SCSIO 12610]|uniref:LytR/AlgR family response regulator transcription factor n=1 Tax=Kordiimonas sp. SCSIO 12610 TaxID=2829597 RepID=UPI00210EC7AB|nr:LytTR family DNA-binding domain-containing protein [Kordiimonas sp. SCSIO 12610]UTW56021.1 LytTR family transcriptional regulator DNA-binding domain-containing protein [Kordiimonas sp. SCSIO 12610]